MLFKNYTKKTFFMIFLYIESCKPNRNAYPAVWLFEKVIIAIDMAIFIIYKTVFTIYN